MERKEERTATCLLACIVKEKREKRCDGMDVYIDRSLGWIDGYLDRAKRGIGEMHADIYPSHSLILSFPPML